MSYRARTLIRGILRRVPGQRRLRALWSGLWNYRPVILTPKHRGLLEAEKSEREMAVATLLKALQDENLILHDQLLSTMTEILKQLRGFGETGLAGLLYEMHEQTRIRNENHLARILGRISLLAYSSATETLTTAPHVGTTRSTETESIRRRYLDLIESALVGILSRDESMAPGIGKAVFDPGLREVGRDWPSQAKTMIGQVRMRNLRHLVERAIEGGVPGDLIETGVWRGGACIYMRAILAAYGDSDRKVWVADSFEGLPPPDETMFPADKGDTHHIYDQLRVSIDEVKENFTQYGLLDNQVEFLQGWFKDTLATSAINQLAILRLDGDMYESTIEALDALYPKLSAGGYVIIDDYNLFPCRQAVTDYRDRHNISEMIEDVDGAAVFWRKEKN